MGETREAELISCLDQPRKQHALLHVKDELHAYVIGGVRARIFIKECLIFDILN